MAVYSVWESYFPAEAAREGRATTETIWRDMTDFDGYLTDELISRPRTRFLGHATPGRG
jgi:hypothetical protein